MFANREHEDPHPPSSRRNPDGDPGRAAAAPGRGAARTRPGTIDRLVAGQSAPGADGSRGAGRVAARAGGAPSVLSRQPGLRSEEHTSELQSLMRNSYAVFCLKKKTTTTDKKKTNK